MGSSASPAPGLMRGEVACEMDVVANGEDHHYMHHGSLLSQPLFYSEYPQHSPVEHASLPNSSGSLLEVKAQPQLLGGNCCKASNPLKHSNLTSSISPLSEDFEDLERDNNGWIGVNHCCTYEASKLSHGLVVSMSNGTELGNGTASYTSIENRGELQVSGTRTGRIKGECCSINCCSELGAQALQCTDKSMRKEKNSDHESTKELSNEYCISLEAQESVDALEFDISQCYSPDEWSSHASTDSPVSASASPLSMAWPSPAIGRCKTAPVGASSKLDMEESPHNSSRSQPGKGKEQKSSESSYHSPSLAEKLSERKRKKLIENLVKIKNDGTVEVDVDRSAEIAPTLFDLDVSDQVDAHIEQDYENPFKVIPSRLNIAMLIVGTRGDVQPFVAIGKRLQEKGHRVRLATHANFRNFVMSNDLEFYPLGGDPKVLAGYMVKNKGFLPSGPSEISIQKKQLKAIMNSLLPACTESDGDSSASFKADAIIANPPAYGHVHVAEYLDVPLHIFFTMPWTPTNEFPHPLARVKQHAGYKISYLVVDSLMWWGMRGLINEFRIKQLNLNPMTYFNMNQGSIAHLPTGYMWSPHLVPKPKDWGPRVDVVGFCFLSLANGYKPPDALVTWLAAGEKPIYVGFGSLPVEHPGKMTEVIVQALKETNQRGIIDKGWGGLGNLKETPESIFLLENCPHDWLFPQCAAVVHHGGAGTTAAGLKAGCPTTIVPFFGDQPFWGERVHAKGVGPPPIPVQQFSLERLVYAINFMLDKEVKQRALELAKQVEEEDGVGEAVDAFHRHWVRKLPQTSKKAAEPPSFLEAILIWLQRLWCLPCCIE